VKGLDPLKLIPPFCLAVKQAQEVRLINNLTVNLPVVKPDGFDLKSRVLKISGV